MFRKLLALSFTLPLSLLWPQVQDRPIRVAIYPLDASSVTDNVQMEVGRNIDYGKIAADLLGSKLISSRIEIINRDQMERLLKEQNFKYNERFDPSQATQFGKMLNVDAIITGKIVRLHTETEVVEQGFGPVKRKKSILHAQVEITSEIISTATAKVLAAPAGDSQIKKELGSSIAGIPTSRRIPGGGSVNTDEKVSSKSQSDPYIREALREAVDKVATQLKTAAASVPYFELARAEAPKIRPIHSAPVTNPGEVRDAAAPGSPTSAATTTIAAAGAAYVKLDDEVGAVIEVSGDVLTFELDEGAKIAVGDNLEVHKAEVRRSPRTGREIAVGMKIGSVQVTEVRTGYSRGKFEGEGAIAGYRIVRSADPAPARATPRAAPTKARSAPAKTIPAPQN